MNTKFGAKKDTEEEEEIRPIMRGNKKEKRKSEAFDATNIMKVII